MPPHSPPGRNRRTADYGLEAKYRAEVLTAVKRFIGAPAV